MALSKEQFAELHKQGLSVDQIISFERGDTPESLGTSQKFQGNQFETQEPKGFGAKVRDFAAGVFGGTKLAEGAGKALAAGTVNKNQMETNLGLGNQQDKIIQAMRKARMKGEDTTRYEKMLRNIQGQFNTSKDVSKDFEESLPTNKQVIGSAARLGTSAAAGTILKGANMLTKAPQAVGFGQGALRGAMSGAITGGVEGAAHGGGIAAEQNAGAGGIAMGAGIGAAGGVALGGALGAVGGGILGRKNWNQSQQKVLDSFVPTPAELSPGQIKKYQQQGFKITPRTMTRPPQLEIPEGLKKTASKYSSLVTKDPFATKANIAAKVDELDDDVGRFLKSNDFDVDPRPLQQKLKEALKGIDDVSLPPERLDKLKKNLVENFMGSIKDSKMSSIWDARKAYDREIERAFRGSPNVIKDVKRALRNEVQDWLSTISPGDEYGHYMKDMSNLIKLEELVEIKGLKERGLSGLGQFWKNYGTPIKAAAGGAAVIGGGGYFLGHSRSDSG